MLPLHQAGVLPRCLCSDCGALACMWNRAGAGKTKPPAFAGPGVEYVIACGEAYQTLCSPVVNSPMGLANLPGGSARRDAAGGW